MLQLLTYVNIRYIILTFLKFIQNSTEEDNPMKSAKFSFYFFIFSLISFSCLAEVGLSHPLKCTNTSLSPIIMPKSLVKSSTGYTPTLCSKTYQIHVGSAPGLSDVEILDIGCGECDPADPGKLKYDLPINTPGTYYVTLKAYDHITGNPVQLADNTVTLTVTPDTNTEPPLDVSEFLAEYQGNGDVLLTWKNPTDPEFSGVMIRYSTTGPVQNNKDGTLIATVKSDQNLHHSFLFTGAIQGKIYYFSLHSMGKNGTIRNTVHYTLVIWDKKSGGGSFDLLFLFVLLFAATAKRRSLLFS